MLMKPPSIFDEVISQDSQNFTTQTKQVSTKGKPSRKQTTIKIGNNSNQYKDRSNQRDNESVHSNGSRKSKDKKTKESTLGRPKIIEQHLQRDQDSHSVHSAASKNSHKSGKKENNIMQRPKIQNPYMKPKFMNDNELSFKNAIGDPEESMINLYHIEGKESPRPIKYIEEKKEEKPVVKEVKEVKQNKKQKKYAPFAEIQAKYSEEDVPIVRIEQPVKNNKYNVGVGLNRFQQNKFNTRPEQKKQIIQSRVYENTDQSRNMFEQSKMANTKSVRRPIFNKDQILNNTSKVSNSIEQSNVSGIDSSSRRKSNSKLRQLFHNSRQKNQAQQSNTIQKQSNMSSFGDLQSQSQAIKPTVGNNRMVQLDKKIADSDDNFGIDSVKSGLDLTVSNNEHLNERDSLIFQFQPERRKGMSVTSKNKIKKESEELINLKNELTSVQYNAATKPPNQQNLLKLKNNNIISKDLKHVDKLLKENEQFLKNSGLLNLSESDKLKRGSEDEFLFKIDDDQQEIYGGNRNVNQPWNKPKENKDQLVNIKKVDRNQKYPNKQKQIVTVKEEKLVVNKPVQKIEVEVKKEPQPPKERVNIKKEKLENRNRVEQVSLPYSPAQEIINKPKERQIQPRKEQIKQRRRGENFRQSNSNQNQPKSRGNAPKQEPKQDYLKSPGKILRNYESSPSKQENDNRSQKSNKSAKKGKMVKQSIIPRDKKIKIQIKDQGPRYEESFYQQEIKPKKQELSINDLSLYSKRNQEKEQKKPNVYHFSDQENEANQKPKSRTDINFYDNQIRSNKPPSSRPPLSGKSAKSKSTSKQKVAKQTTIKISTTNQQFNKNQIKKAQPGKKLTLMEQALMKHNQSSEDDRSQQSFSSRQDFSHNSRKSSNSKGSKKSVKQNSIKINPKSTNIIGQKVARPPPYQQKLSSSSHEQEMQQQERKRSNQHRQNAIVNQRAIISKNCTFIDERGRLVQKDLVIKGKEIYGQNRIEDSTIQAFQRMKRTKQSHRSRSKSRQRKGQKRRNSREEGESSYENSSYCDSFYENSSQNKNTARGNSGANQSGGLRQFLKPVEQVPIYNQSYNPYSTQSKQYARQQQTPKTLNEMFVRKNKNTNYNNSGFSNNPSEVQSRRSLKRTQKSSSKR